MEPEAHLTSFHPYSSIQLTKREKFVKKIKSKNYDKPHILWVASEKIHGANFSIHCSEKWVRYGRRNDFITKQIPIKCNDPENYFLQAFFNARDLISKFHNKLHIVFQDIKKIYPKMIKFTVYGEYFGGFWPEYSSQSKPVQRGVYYTPLHEYMAFDIKINTNEGEEWVDVLEIPKILKENIKSIPVYAKGTFEQMFEIQTKIDSTIPQLLGMPKIQNNIIEGMVIRPNCSIDIAQSTRLLLKKKNQEFMQIAYEPVKKQKQQIDPQIQPFLTQLLKYLNFNRIESALSKFPDFKELYRLKDEIVKDMMTDAETDEYKEPNEPQLKEKVMIELEKRTIQLLNEYFIKI